MGIVAYPGFSEYVNRVLARLIAVVPATNLPARAYVVAAGSFSAFATPCGAIAVDWGMLRGLRHEDELAFVLAHELGHVVFRHHRSDFFVDAQHYAVTATAIADQVLEKIETESGSPIDPNNKLGRILEIGILAEKISERYLLTAWTREQEDAADRFGVDLMIRAGYNPGAVMIFFSTLDAWEKAQASGTAGTLGDLIAERLGQQTVGSLDLGSLIGASLSAVKDLADRTLQRSHYPADERRQNIQEYIAAHYRKTVMVPLAPLPWHASGDSEISKAYEQFIAADGVFEQIEKGSLAEAENLARVGIGEPLANEGFPRYAFFFLRMAQGQKDKAKANLDSALRTGQPGVTLWRARIQVAEEEGRVQEAAALLDEARLRLDDPPALLPDRIRLYPKVGRGNEVTPLLIECELRWRQMAEQCMAENNRLRP
ncbi:MAG: M48 family metalloprotease [Rhodospirillales bacterium]|nr:M48 family metalloprotease [Rhodospirillales bacterium]